MLYLSLHDKLKFYRFPGIKVTATVLMVLLFTGCNIFKKAEKKEPDCTPVYFESEYTRTENNVPYYVSDSFAVNATNRYTIKYLKNNFSKKLNTKKISFRNIHDTSVVDTIYKFSNSNNNIEYYHGKYASFIKNFEVSDPTFRLYGCISVGLSKDSLKKQFDIPRDIGNTLKIGTSDNTSVYKFYFDNNKIGRITSSLYFD